MLPRGIASFEALRERDERSTSRWADRPTPCCTCWPPRTKAGSTSRWPTSTGCRAGCPASARSRRQSADVHMEDVHRAGGILAILGELDRAGLLDTERADRARADPGRRARPLGHHAHATSEAVRKFFRAAPGGVPTQVAFSQAARWDELDIDRARAASATPSTRSRKDGGLAVLYGNIAVDGCIVKTAGVDESILKFAGPARVFESQDAAVRRHPGRPGRSRRRGGDPLRGPEGRPGHAGDALSDQLSEVEGAGQGVRAGHRRPLLRRHVGPVDRPRLAGGGRGRH